MIIPYLDKIPVIDDSVFIGHGSVIIGDVILEKDVSVWFNCVVRGDVNFIRVGERTNIQDGAILHVTYQKYPLIIGKDVSIGHGAIVHGCTVKDNVLIGMGALLLDNCIINSNSLVAAGALIKENFIVPEGARVGVILAKIIRDLTSDEISLIKQRAQNYIMYAKNFKKN
ncbi:MAG: gamma carbonic anhydrase family protein [Ignavibacteria bacterium]|nr:gamma carbonic anhydrase family protein [Ignavibacteria bacterium]